MKQQVGHEHEWAVVNTMPQVHSIAIGNSQAADAEGFVDVGIASCTSTELSLSTSCEGQEASRACNSKLLLLLLEHCCKPNRAQQKNA
jgi:hypothetical protein